MSSSINLPVIGPYEGVLLDGTRLFPELVQFDDPENFGLPQLPGKEGPGVLDELLDPPGKPLVSSAAEYRRAQIDAHGDSGSMMFFLTLNQVFNRYLFQIENRHEELESPSERTVNDAADFFHGVAQLSVAAAGAAPGKGAPRPRTNTMDAIRHNADIAAELARRAATRGRISTTPQAFGSRAHKFFRRLNERLDRRLVAERSPFRVSAEEFRDLAGELAPRRSQGSIGADAVIRDSRNPAYLEIFDLKTHGGAPLRISSPRQADFTERFGTRAQEIYRER